MRFVMSMALLCVALAGCGSDTAPTAKSIDGPWSQDFSTSGSFLTMHLTSAGTSVSGTGNFCGEAGPCGTLSVVGTVNGSAVHLDLTLTQQQPATGPATVEHFDGAFSGLYTLVGTEISDGSTSAGQTVTFRHPAFDPP
jgi:hypothetical protein